MDEISEDEFRIARGSAPAAMACAEEMADVTGRDPSCRGPRHRVTISIAPYRLAERTLRIVILGCALILSLLTLTWIGFFAGLPITRFHFPICLAAVLAVGASRRFELAFVLALLGASVVLAAVIFDPTYDGMAYHQVSIIAMTRGWNPVWAPHVVAWWYQAFPDLRWLIDTIDVQGLWSDHYPKASWILGATVAATTGLLDTGKWTQGFFAVLAILALFRGLLLTGVRAWFAALASAAAVLSPVMIAQLGTNYVDGLLADAMAIQAGAVLAWARTRRGADLWVLATGMIVAVNLKFTGAVYSGLIVVLVVAVAAISWRRPTRGEVAAATVGAGLLCLISAQTWLNNIIVYGSAIYPLNVYNVMTGQMSADFFALTRWVRFWNATFSPPSNFPEVAIGVHSAQALLPRLWHYYLIVRYPDARLGGFGTLFGYSLIFALAALAISMRSGARRRWTRSENLPLLGILFWIPVSAALNPEFWWARYAPQIWWIPVIASVLVFSSGRQRLALLMLAPAAVGIALSLFFWTSEVVETQTQYNRFMARATARKAVVLAEGWRTNFDAFTIFHHMRQAHVALRIGPVDGHCDHLVGPSSLACIRLDEPN